MNKLVFKASEVSRVVEHAIATNAKPEFNSEILLVHDQGVYLMSKGQPRDMIDENKNYVVYAQGCNPNEDADWYETAHDLVGGDDFGAELPFAEAIKKQIENGAEEITLILAKDSIKLGKEKVSTLRKCSICGRLLKKQDDDICPKCQEEQSTPSTDEVSEANKLLEFVEQLTSSPSDEQSSEQTNEQSLDEQPSEPKQEVKIKPGVVIRECFMNLVSNGKINDEIMNMLTDTEATKSTLGIRYAFLKEFNPEVGIKEQAYINGHSRYTSKTVEVNGKQYLITNDIYIRNVEPFTNWAKSL